MGDDITTALRRTWESAAPGWAKWEGVIAAGLADVTDTMLDMAEVDAGMRVLDLACGAGSQSLQAAERVGPKGQVVASDISATMLTHVREAAARRGLTNIGTLECAAEDLPQTLDAFDAAISRLGLMLFPAPKQAFGSSARPEAEGAHRRACLHDAFGEPLHVTADANPASPCREGTTNSGEARDFRAGRSRCS